MPNRCLIAAATRFEADFNPVHPVLPGAPFLPPSHLVAPAKSAEKIQCAHPRRRPVNPQLSAFIQFSKYPRADQEFLRAASFPSLPSANRFPLIPFWPSFVIFTRFVVARRAPDPHQTRIIRPRASFVRLSISSLNSCRFAFVRGRLRPVLSVVESLARVHRVAHMRWRFLAGSLICPLL